MVLLNKVTILPTFFLVLLLGGLLSCTQETVDKAKPEIVALRAAINACDAITERAAAHLVAIVEFQKLEIAGRKARVFKLCMNDRGYIENKAWLKNSQPVAKSIAKDTQVSVDEALENLRRAHMKQFDFDQGHPIYWVLR